MTYSLEFTIHMLPKTLNSLLGAHWKIRAGHAKKWERAVWKCPKADQHSLGSSVAPGVTRLGHPGLSKRELFAAMAMQGLLSAVYSSKEMLNEFTTNERKYPAHVTGSKAISENAVAYADELLAELAKRPKS
jgi:hypothetical protein